MRLHPTLAGAIGLAALASPALAHVGDHGQSGIMHHLAEHGLAGAMVLGALGVAFVVLKKRKG